MVSRVWKYAMKKQKDQNVSDVVLPTTSKHLGPEDRAALIITRWGRRYSERKINVDRTRLIERIELERALHYGLTRVVFFLCIFMLNASLTLVDVGGQYKLDLRNNIRSVLDLDSFDGVTTLEQLRDYIPTLGTAIKTFAVSKNQRYLDPFSMRLLNDRTTFTSPMSLYTPFRIEGAEFTLAAWVEVLPNADLSKSIPLLRKPMQTDPSLTCWGWFQSPEFRFGAHDFHSLDSKEQETSISTGLPLLAGLTHEVLVLKGGGFTFYRDGEEVAISSLPRPVTDCAGDVVLLGSTSVALSSVSFYARALQPNEVQEMYVGGQPLTELATGSVLPLIQSTSEDQIIGEVSSTADQTRVALGGVNDQTVFSTILSMGSDKEKTVSLADNEVLHPPDGAGPTVLSSAARGSQLPAFGERVWKEGGSKTVETEIARKNSRLWRNDTSEKSYWPVVIGPIFAENPNTGDLVHDLPFQISNTVPGFTINYWYQSLMENRSDGICLVLYTKSCDVPNCKARHDRIFDNRFHPNRKRGWMSGSTFHDCPDDCLAIGHCSYGFYDYNFLERVNWKDIDGSWRVWSSINNGLWSEDDEGQSKPDELFFNAKNTAEMLPVAWRMLTIQVDLVSNILRFYLDGEFVQDSSTQSIPIPSWFRASDFSDGYVKMVSEDIIMYLSDQIPINISSLARFADVRFYMDVLTKDEIRSIHEDSTWSEGSKIRQCALSKDDDYYDTVGTDLGGRDCLWYSKFKRKMPYICSSIDVQRMCPVTCKGRRQCHDGSLDPGFKPPARKPFYRAFSRVMWLKPKDKTVPLICPSDKIRHPEVLTKCRKIFKDNGCDSCEKDAKCDGTTATCLTSCTSPLWKSSTVSGFYKGPSAYRHCGIHPNKRTDLWDCDALDLNLDGQQCSWNSSWIPHFRQDVHATKFYSITVWIKPTENSLGMPRYFFPFIRLLSRLSTPFFLLSFVETNPKKVDAMWAIDWITQQFTLGTTNIDYKDWTMLYHSHEFDGTTWTKCYTVNAYPFNCVTIPRDDARDGDTMSPIDGLPEEFLEAIEVDTELMLAPIEFTARKESKSELQQRFYKRKAELEKIQGPRTSEPTRVKLFESVPEKEVKSYDEKLGLVAPPILFQTRLQTAECNNAVAKPFLKSQFDLVNSTQCPAPDMCPSVTGSNDVLTCAGTETSLESFYGLNFSSLKSEDGFADFLFTFSDNPIIVRGGQILPTRNFFDSMTQSGQVVTAFVSPGTGVLTVLTLGATLDGASVQTESKFQMLSFLPKDRMREAWVLAVCLFVALGLVLVLDVIEIFAVLQDLEISAVLQDVILDRRAGKKLGIQGVLENHNIGEKLQHLYRDIFEVSYDLMQIIIITVYGVMVVNYNFPAEARSAALVQDLVSVPFVAADVSFDDKLVQFFAALDAVFQEFENKDQLSSFGFAIMVLNLVKILQSTAAHPRVGVLVSTLAKAFDDLIHFGILFIVVFLTFAFTGMWTFSNERSEFATLQAGMTTQFAMLNGEFPEGFEEDNRMIAYAVITFVVQFLLMLNFLLAIVVDSYAAVKEDIKEQETDQDIFSDVYTSVVNGFTAFWKKWPSGLHRKLKTKLHLKAIGPSHLVNALGISEDAARSIIQTYSKNEAVPFAADDLDVYDSKLLQHAAKVLGRKEAHGMVALSSGDIQREELQKQIQQLNERMSQMNEQLMARLDAMSSLPSSTSNGFRPNGNSSPPPRGQSAQRSPGHINIVASTQPMAQMPPLNVGERAVTGLDGQLVYLN